MSTKNKQVAVSGVRPTGDLHIGNYLGAIKQFVELQEKYKTYFFIADLHAITEPQDPEKLANQTLDIAALYLACGLDPQKTTLFVQSHMPEHLELAHILGTLTPMGELSRMTQYKEKVEEGKPSNFGLFAYPVLMAADILIYRADAVPVGEDQLQHVELARTLVRKFNSRFGETFKEPKTLLQKEGARIMGLDDPSKKMSKSAASANNYIGIIDSEEEIRRKIKIAVTDSGKEIKFDPKTKPAISNLLTIYSRMADISVQELEKKYADKNYAEFKSDLADALVAALSPIQKKYKELAQNHENVLRILKECSVRAREVAEATMKDVRAKIGLLENAQRFA
ncbi:tryptophan--tRNA ligase [Candidatus Giovannonibacteria bacterium RIFCSPLOWO2_12_FULL_44_25]|uniref:Tryptophan--tRNA ligase n=1 Tax=Candidatus Giovannonibacteria bacterium RIFCSPHIGHO2_02_FULL_45_40 TaxID=1798337 RepID=A0A1F5WBI6_9BACT|nr:MAG: tryptophan--tRNA ligase [Candidatus Giovannonibacteria bacterium GWA2_45_15]OGF60425.1 MAG: tryptophan--tRNA ligase [Candidatus Giovannonibacteria bacterium RIFCSPHIGHO2_01_45_12]OGF60815.1 MAG: tryptophan--tRNA ligase [Candidatus Giovannonibacteria bacterium RIFCSPHIGHO2_01_FULL_44_100]OGF72930.1 MAG: tryptophan--tRNA ligase [Candidatus Giovannonibacteria bacterium RIFCSPHIGHO2_02_FULL_45_40]OGF84263.1 MAG: tryptophan--tRNA ligase [Candidatus Giovannonibacteria bacterium RIFCSPLOWO2_01